jgi:hypothetical protein
MMPGERQAVHAALSWATRHGGWTRSITRHAYSTPALSLVWWEPGGELVVDLEEPPFRLSFTPECPRQALDVLAAISVLPAHFSTVYAIGRARGALDQWREEVNSCGT